MHNCVSSLQTQGIATFRRMSGACAGILLLLLQLLAPIMGQAATGGEWVEICSEYGAVEVLIAPDGTPTEVPDCPDCDSCTLCASLTVVSPTSPPESAVFTIVDRQGLSRPGDRIADNPAQFWPDNRGPPRAKISYTHTGLRALAPSHSKGEVPCS